VIEGRFPEFADIGPVTSLEAPHRIADAIFRDSRLDGVSFRDSAVGRAFVESTIRNANGLYRYCPTALIYGVWDSTALADRAGLGNKFARAVTAEIIGYSAQAGVHTSSRIDPLGIRNIEIYATAGGGWTNDPAEAKQARTGPEKTKPSEVNHSNIPPTIDVAEQNLITVKKNDFLRGGVTLDRAELCFVLSLPGLRRLRFPRPDGDVDSTRNQAARSVLAALALAGIALELEQGFDLRSRCLLIPNAQPGLERIAADGSVCRVHLGAEPMLSLLEQAVAVAEKAGLEWPREPVVLKPERHLIELVRRSRAASGPAE